MTAPRPEVSSFRSSRRLHPTSKAGLGLFPTFMEHRLYLHPFQFEVGWRHLTHMSSPTPVLIFAKLGLDSSTHESSTECLVVTGSYYGLRKSVFRLPTVLP